MASKSFVKPRGLGCLLSIDASPGATRTEIVGVNEWRGALQVKIAAEPVEGAANEELIRFLSEKLGIKSSEVELVHGARSSHKTLAVPLGAERVESLLRGD